MVATAGESTEPESAFRLKVENRMGIHARPAAMIVRVANDFPGDMWVEKDGERVNAKSIMGLMMLAAGPGSELCFQPSGGDPTEVRAELEDLFRRKFDED
jgi:phosphocarrier protein